MQSLLLLITVCLALMAASVYARQRFRRDKLSDKVLMERIRTQTADAERAYETY